MKKPNSEFYLAPLKFFTDFLNPSSNLLHRPQSGDFDTENTHFPCSQLEVGTREHRPITEKGILSGVSVSIFKSNFKEASETVPLTKLYNWSGCRVYSASSSSAQACLHTGIYMKSQKILLIFIPLSRSVFLIIHILSLQSRGIYFFL